MSPFIPERVLATISRLQLAANAFGKAMEDGLDTWASAIRVGDPDGILSSQLQPGPDLAVQTT